MKIAVIIPLYNKADYVKRALESVMAQTFTDWECIVVNDGSTDDSAQVVREWVGGKSEEVIGKNRFQVIDQENAGVSVARNRGIAESRGEYVCFLDADDWWAPTFLEEMVKFAEEYPDAGLYASNYWYYKPGKTHVAVKSDTGYINYPKLYCEGEMPVWTGAVMIPRAVLEEVRGKNEEVRTKSGEYFQQGITLGEDFLLWSKIALQYKVAFLNKPLAYYNNDIPASLRLTRHLHVPETHMLWHLGEIEDRIQKIENRTQNIDDWKRLLDKLRVKGLQKYWLSDEYHDVAKKELQKVDWIKQSLQVRLNYKMPILVVRMFLLFMHIGSFVKQQCIDIFRK